MPIDHIITIILLLFFAIIFFEFIFTGIKNHSDDYEGRHDRND